MATNGNHPNPTQQLEALQAAATAATQATSVEDFISRAEGLFQYLETIGRELGSAGGADERDIAAFCEGQRSDLHAFLRKLVNRYRRRAADLERITGKTEG